MPRTLPDDPDDPDGEDEEDVGESEYAPEADEAGELWCPKCGAVMYADASLCPSCGDYVKPGLPPRRALPLWMWMVGLLILLLILGGLVLR